jgi:DNA-binding NarL/FixJ family response regulator
MSPLSTLRSGRTVAGQASNSPQLLALVRETVPDPVVADIWMPPSDTTEGLEAAKVIRAERPGTAILLLSAYADVEHAMELAASGRSIGHLLKSRITNVEDFLDTVQRVAKGGSVARCGHYRARPAARCPRSGGSYC